MDRMLGEDSNRKQSGKTTRNPTSNLITVSGTVDEESFIRQFSVPGSVLILSWKDLDLQLASLYTSLASRDWRRRVEVRKRSFK